MTRSFHVDRWEKQCRRFPTFFYHDLCFLEGCGVSLLKRSLSAYSLCVVYIAVSTQKYLHSSNENNPSLFPSVTTFVLTRVQLRFRLRRQLMCKKSTHFTMLRKLSTCAEANQRANGHICLVGPLIFSITQMLSPFHPVSELVYFYQSSLTFALK